MGSTGSLTSSRRLRSIGRYRRDWRGWLTPLAVFSLLASPAIVLSLGAVGKAGVSSEVWLAAVRSRVPHHVLPSTWPAIKFARFAALLAVVGLAAALARRSFDRFRIHMLVWAAVGVAWALAAGAAEAVGSPSMLIFQPARATDLWYAFGVIALMAVCLTSLRTSSVLALVPFVLFHPTGLAGMLDHPLFETPAQSMRQVCDWARTHTPSDAAFLV